MINKNLRPSLQRHNVFFVFLLLLVSPLKAQTPPPTIRALVDGSTLASFVADGTMTSLGDIKTMALVGGSDDVFSDSDTPQLSPDNTWIVRTAYSPAVIAYGRLGQPLIEIPVSPDFDYRAMWATFSPDSRYLSYTLAVEYQWILGFVELSSGKRIEFTGEFADIPPNIDKSKPFGDMTPDAVLWSADGKTLYVDTYIPFWGCRGTYDIYAMDITTLNFDAPPDLPPTWEIAQTGDDVFSYAFSSDQTHLAYAFHDASCESGPHGIALRDIATGHEQSLAQVGDGQFLQVAGWTSDGQQLIYAASEDQGGDTPGYPLFSPILSVFDVETGQSRSLSLPKDASDAPLELKNILPADNTLFFITSQTNDDGSEMDSLFGRSLTDDKDKFIVSAVDIEAATCGESLFFVTREINADGQTTVTKLYSHPLNDINAESRLLSTATTIQSLSCGG